MENKISCEIVRDLLPSYVDNLTSEVTNQAIETHIAKCSECKEAVLLMKEPDPKPEASDSEVDYLKRVRRNSTKTALLLGIIMSLFAMVLVFARINFVGNRTGWDAVSCSASISKNTVTVSGRMIDTSRGVARIGFEEEDGVVRVKIFSAPKSFLNKTDFSKSYEAKGDVTEVRFDQYIIWENGAQIGRTASELYAHKNSYIGNMSANGKISGDLAIADQFGSFKNELQTTKEPYGWKLCLEEPIVKEDESSAKQIMTADSYVMIAVIDNLGSVTWENENEEGKQEFTVTKEEASAFAGKDIKKCAQSPKELQELLKSLSIKWSGTKDLFLNDTFYVNVCNQSDAKVYGMKMNYYIGGKHIGTRGVQHADNSIMKKGSKEQFDFMKQDFNEDISAIGLSEFSFDLAVVDKEGKETTICENRAVAAKYGWTFYYTITEDENGIIVLKEG